MVLENLVVSITAISYQGFDPLHLLAVLNKRATAANTDPEIHKNNLTTLAVLSTMKRFNIEH